MSEEPKPHRPKGLLCPLFRKDVSKVCHRCEMYQGYGVTKSGPEGLPIVRTEWRCALAWGPHMTFEAGQGIHYLAASQDGLRNSVLRFFKQVRLALNLPSPDQDDIDIPPQVPTLPKG